MFEFERRDLGRGGRNTRGECADDHRRPIPSGLRSAHDSGAEDGDALLRGRALATAPTDPYNGNRAAGERPPARWRACTGTHATASRVHLKPSYIFWRP